MKNEKDIILNLLRTIEKQTETIDKLTDKVMARNLDEYRAGDQDPVPHEERMKQEGAVDMQDAPGIQILEALNEPTD